MDIFVRFEARREKSELLDLFGFGGVFIIAEDRP